EVKTPAGDLEPVAAAVDDVVQRDPLAKVGETAPGQDGETRSIGPGQAREVRANRRRQERRAGRRDQRRQGAVVVEDHNETGALPELPVETVEERHRETQDAFAPVVSTGIRASSLSRSPAHR